LFIVVAVTTTNNNTPDNIAEEQQPNVSATGVYVPPSLRKHQQASSLRKQQAYKKKVPDITSQQAFPSLQPMVQNKDSR